MSQQEVNRYLGRYFKDPAIEHKDVAKILTFIEDYAKRGQQIHMVQKIFRVVEMSITKDNLKVLIKRYLHIINQILESDDQCEPNQKYKQAVSAQIVYQYITLLRNALNHGATDLLPEIKLYRKRWAKRITDQAYTSLQTEVLKQLKCDLDKGFSDEIVKKLTKSYQKRQFSSADLSKYLPNANNQSSEVRKSSTVSSSSSQQEGQPRKKLKSEKSEEFVAENRNESSDMVMPRHSSYIPSHSNTYGNGPTGDTRRPNQIMYPSSSYPNLYPPALPQYPPNRVFNSALGPQQQFYQPNPYNTGYNYQNYNYGPGYQNYPNMPYDYQRGDAFALQLPPKLNKLILKMEKMKKCWSFECKSCGIMISTSQKYEEHMIEHFQGGQKQYEVEHSRADHTRKANKSLLPSLQQWIESNRVKLADRKFQVAIENDMSGSEVCCICKGDLTVSWSDGMDSWVFEDAIRTKNKDNRISICHSECYHTIDQFEKSSDEIVQ